MLFREKWKIFSSGSEPLENYNNDFLLSSQELETQKAIRKFLQTKKKTIKLLCNILQSIHIVTNKKFAW